VVKAIEAMYVRPLYDHVLKGVGNYQFGFIPGQSVFSNLTFVVSWVRDKVTTGQRCFGVFIDLKSAYNTVNRTKLEAILRGRQIFDPDMLNLLFAVYERIEIVHGSHSFRPQDGLIQGSILAPQFFDIYLDEWVKKELKPLLLEGESISAYADDMVILLRSVDQVKRVTGSLEDSLAKYNLILNKKKSGILEFVKRSGKSLQILDLEVNGFPVVSTYRYLGTILSHKLYTMVHLQKVKRKIAFFYKRAYGPYSRGRTLIYEPTSGRFSVGPCLSSVSH